MSRRLYKGDPLTPDERAAYEEDLISFCDCELDLLGDIEGLNVFYAGGFSPLWMEGLSQRIGERGTLTALDTGSISESQELLREADLAAPVRLLSGDVFRPPFRQNTFDLAYSAGLFHELDVSVESAGNALAALSSVERIGGRVATSDFIDAAPAVQLEDEELQRELAWKASCVKLYGIGPPDRLVALHEKVLAEVWWRTSPPQLIRYLGKTVLAEEEPEELRHLPAGTSRKLRERREALRKRIRREGYTRPATLYIEGLVRGP